MLDEEADADLDNEPSFERPQEFTTVPQEELALTFCHFRSRIKLESGRASSCTVCYRKFESDEIETRTKILTSFPLETEPPDPGRGLY